MITRYGPNGIRYSASGQPAASVDILVVHRGTNDPASLFNDQAGQSPAVNPAKTDPWGNLTFFVEAGLYDLLVNKARIPVQVGREESGDELLLLAHINNPTPHPAYDDIVDLSTIFENAMH